MRISVRIAIIGALALSGFAAVPVEAKTVVVGPGPGTPLQDAIDAAAPKDTILVTPGAYPEAIVIDKPVKLRRQGSRFSVVDIDAGCGADHAIAIAADGVQLSHLHATGGAVDAISIAGRDRVKLVGVVAVNRCGGGGIHVVGATRVVLSNVSVDAGVGVGATLRDLSAGAGVRVSGLEGTGSTVGGNTHVLLIENVQPGAAIISRCTLSHADVAVLGLRNSDGVRIQRCFVANGSVGVAADSASEDDVVASSSFAGNVVDVVDDGTSNCWRRNVGSGGAPPSGNGSTAGCP